MFTQPGFGVQNNVIGNLTAASSVPSLEPQTSNSVEGTVYGVVSDLAVMEVAGFYQVIEDKIGFQNAGTDFVARNLGSARYAGLEGTLQLSMGRVRPYVQVELVRSLDEGNADPSTLPSYPTRSGAGGRSTRRGRGGASSPGCRRGAATRSTCRWWTGRGPRSA